MGGLRRTRIHTSASVEVAFLPYAPVGPSSKVYPPPTYIEPKNKYVWPKWNSARPVGFVYGAESSRPIERWSVVVAVDGRARPEARFQKARRLG